MSNSWIHTSNYIDLIEFCPMMRMLNLVHNGLAEEKSIIYIQSDILNAIIITIVFITLHTYSDLGVTIDLQPCNTSVDIYIPFSCQQMLFYSLQYHKDEGIHRLFVVPSINRNQVYKFLSELG